MNIRLIDYKEIKDFPSGSALEFFNDRLYIAGDDAKQLLVLNKRWKELERIKLFEHPADRIPKDVKTDLESSLRLSADGHPELLLLGSGSAAQRNKGILVNVDSGNKEEKSLDIFYDRVRKAGIKELNIEAATVVNEYAIFCNRGNLTNRSNHLIITKLDFWKNQQDVELIVLKMELPVNDANVIGISGLTYSAKNDWLIFTASTEVTQNAYDDGEIGESYIGLIENASRKIGRKSMKVNGILPLSQFDKSFVKKKVESLCIQRDKTGRLKLHLVADNDTGITYLFKIRLRA
jgi:hypothetical protein